MSDEYQDGTMIASQVIAALQLAIDRYGDLPVTYTDYEYGDSQVRFISLRQEGVSTYDEKLPQRISISRWPDDGEEIMRAKKIGETV